MRDKLTYKEFIGTVHFSMKDAIFYGRIDGINDLVTFEGESVKDLKLAFEEPKLHSQAYKVAKLRGKSLNQFVSDAIKNEVASH